MDHKYQPLQRLRHARLIKTIHRKPRAHGIETSPGLWSSRSLRSVCRSRHCQVTREPCDAHGAPFNLPEEHRSQNGHKLPRHDQNRDECGSN